MAKKYDDEFQKIKDKYDTIEMNITDDREMLKKEKAKLQARKDNHNFSKKGIAYSALLTLFFALQVFLPIGAIAQIIVGAIALGMGGMTLGFINKVIKYGNEVTESENIVKIVEERLQGYENDRKVLDQDIKKYFDKNPIEKSTTAKMPKYVAND
jgi:hypothetical protein